MRKLIKLAAVIAVLAIAAGLLWNGFLKEQYELYSYPLRYTAEVEAAADRYGVPSLLVYAVIRTESSFEPDARSSAGAKGLMQLMDITNEDICNRLGASLDADIYDPAVNIERGTYYLSYLYRQFGTWRETVAAYNAGIGRVRGWLNDPTLSDDGVTLKSIPFAETKAYVDSVFSAMDKYKELYFTE